jgi:Ser/Thr protein kinase RdoA (MazF antagonist)
VQEYGRGNVNDTFLVTPVSSPGKPFILQRLNTHVFPQPQLIMQNLRVLTDHVRRRLLSHTAGQGRRWEFPEVLVTQNEEDFWVDSHGSFWRALSFIESARAWDTIQSQDHAREVGRALGMFHLLVSDLPIARLADTLPGFHVTPGYLRHYDEILEQRPPQTSPEVEFALESIRLRRGWAPVLEQARRDGTLSLRPMHGDPKINNVLLDAATGQAVSLIDLDTVKPGLVQYDLGDCLRSGCNPLGEETAAWQEIHFHLGYCRAILTGYLFQAREFLTDNDYHYLYDGIRLIAFELGLRFFTDYLAGNIYFKALHPQHNLRRALVQFQLMAGIESQETAIRNLIGELR